MLKSKKSQKGSLLLKEGNDIATPMVSMKKVKRPKPGLKSSSRNTKKLRNDNSSKSIENGSGINVENLDISTENKSMAEETFPAYEDRLGSSFNLTSSESMNTISDDRPQLKIINNRRGKKKRSKRGPGDGKKKAEEEANIKAALNAIPHEAIKNAVETVYELIEKKEKLKNNPSLLDEEQSVFMQVTAIKIPKTPCMRIRIPLPHPLITETSDICLFVHDVNKAEKDPEVTIDLYKERLKKCNINNITQIITLKQMRAEYSQYEQQRHLLKQFDVFLCDSRISKRVVDFFGKHFRNNLKIPVPVQVLIRNLRKEVNKAISKTTMNIHSKGNVYIIKVAHNKQSVEEAIENIKAVIGELANRFPGGIANIRSLYLKGAFTLPIPVYVTFKSRNEVEVPVVKPIRPKLGLPVEDELSTVLGARVVVYPGGKVVVKKDPEYEGELEWDEDEDEEEHSKGDEWKKSKKDKKKEPVKGVTVPEIKGDDDDDDNEDDDDDDENEKPDIKEEPENEEDYDNKNSNNRKEDDEPEVKDEVDVKSEPEDSDVEEAEDAYLKEWKRKWEEEEENDDDGPSTVAGKQKKTKKLKTESNAGNRMKGENKNKAKKQKNQKKVQSSGNIVDNAIEELSKVKKQKAVNKNKGKQLMNKNNKGKQLMKSKKIKKGMVK